MSTNQLYHTCSWGLQQLCPQERKNRLVVFAWFMAGTFASKSVQLQKVAQKISRPAKELSVCRRLEILVAKPLLKTGDRVRVDGGGGFIVLRIVFFGVADFFGGVLPWRRVD